MKKTICISFCTLVFALIFVLNSCKKDKEEEKPIAAFSYSPSTVYIGTTVYFNNESSNAARYKWDFGDGQTSDLTSPSHSYSTSGNKTVSLTAYSESGAKMDYITKTINVKKGTGDVMFWTDSSTIYNITVTLKGTTKKITKYYNSTPSYCGASGCATYWDIEAGTYYFYASNNLYNWDGYVTVTNDGCSKMLLYAKKGEKQNNPETQSMEVMTLGIDEE